MSGAHWLAGVEDVLKADTGDLRQLAVLAGGDPATFYLGTPMDGADLRGQDLRGMLFTGLDPAKSATTRKPSFPTERAAAASGACALGSHAAAKMGEGKGGDPPSERSRS